MRTSFVVLMLLIASLLASCGLITEQSIYEGFRTQQGVKEAGSKAPTDKMDTYDAYEKQRQKAKNPD